MDGTPVDCTKIALQELLNQKPDLIISGINQGANLGHNWIIRERYQLHMGVLF